MRMLITGGCGFIGSNFVRYVLREHPGTSITNLDKLTYAGNPENLRNIEDDPRYRFVRGDICDPAAVREAMEGADAVVHFAAESHVDRSITGPAAFIETNVVGTGTLLDAALELKVPRFVHISTDEVYGSTLEDSFKETDVLHPSSPYSASKAASDLLALSYVTTHRLPVMVTRSSNNFGPYQYPEKIIPLFIANALEDRPLPVYGDGLNVRDWLYVEDNCRAIDFVLERGTEGEIYNIGADTELTNLELTRRILELLGKPADLITYVEDRKGHDRRYSVDTERIRGLGWEPQQDFSAALTATVEWYRSNRSWWERLQRQGATPVRQGSGS